MRRPSRTLAPSRGICTPTSCGAMQSAERSIRITISLCNFGADRRARPNRSECCVRLRFPHRRFLPVSATASTVNRPASRNLGCRDSTRIDTHLESFADYTGNSCSAVSSSDETSIETRFRVKTVRSRFAAEFRPGCDTQPLRPINARPRHRRRVTARDIAVLSAPCRFIAASADAVLVVELHGRQFLRCLLFQSCLVARGTSGVLRPTSTPTISF